MARKTVELPDDCSMRGGVIWFRKRWPADVIVVRPELKGRYFAKSLRTSDAKIAATRANAVRGEFLRACEDARVPKRPASAVEWIELLDDDAASEAIESSFVVAEAEWAANLPLHPMLAAKLPKDAQDRVRALIRNELIAAIRADADALVGAGMPAEELAPIAVAAVEAEAPLPWETLLRAWNTEKKPAASTFKKYSATFRTITSILGYDDLRRVTVEEAIRFKEARLAAKINVGTIEDDMRAAGGVCKWAVKNRKLASNPFDGIAPKASRHDEGNEPRAPYTDAEAKAILTTARDLKGWLRWGGWLMAFTGARVSEVAELKRGDVREEDGIPILDFKPTALRGGKNRTFQRLVPVHPAIIAEGFLDYVKTLPDDAKGPLFPDVTANASGDRSVNGQASMMRWLRGKVKITDPDKGPSHSWRHRIEDDLRRARAPEEVVDAITGRHNPRNAGAGYGRGYRRMPAEVLIELRKVPSPV